MRRVKISDETNINRIEHKSKKNMLIGTIVGYLSILVSLAHGFILTPMIITSVGVANYGLYGIATSLIALFLMDFGLNTTTETYLAKLRAAGNKEKVQKFLASIFRIYLYLTILLVFIIVALFFLCPYMYQNSYNPAEIEELQILIVIVGGFSVVSFPTNTFTSVITTYEKFGFNKFADLVQKLIYLGLTIASIKLDWGIIGITAVNAASGLAAIIMRALFMRYYLGIKLDLRLKLDSDKRELKSILTFSAWGLIIAVLQRLIFNITPSILGIVSSSDQVSMFMLVYTIESYVFMIGAMSGTFFMAKVARVEESGTQEEKREKLQALAGKVGKVQFFIISMILFGFASVGREFITFWLSDTLPTNPDFINIYWCILAICAYELVRIPELPIYNAMFTEGHVKPLAINTIIKATINISLAFLLSSNVLTDYLGIPLNGAFGACVAIAIARVVDLILNNIMYRKYLGVSIFRFFKDVYSRALISVAISFGVGLLCHFLMPVEDVVQRFFVNGIIFVILYLICTLFITFNVDERHYYVNVIFEVLHIKKRLTVNGVVPNIPEPIDDNNRTDLVKEENASDNNEDSSKEETVETEENTETKENPDEESHGEN